MLRPLRRFGKRKKTIANIKNIEDKNTPPGLIISLLVEISKRFGIAPISTIPALISSINKKAKKIVLIWVPYTHYPLNEINVITLAYVRKIKLKIRQINIGT